MKPQADARPEASSQQISLSSQTSSIFGDTIHAIEELPNLSGEQEAQISQMFDALRQRNKEKARESNQRHLEEIRELTKKYHQATEQLKVQQELMNNKENSESFLQEQLNKSTIEVTHLRLIREGLNSSLRQATAQIQFLTKELDKMRISTAQNEEKRSADVTSIRDQLSNANSQLESLKADYQSTVNRLKSEKESLKNQVLGLRKKVEESEDENFKLTKNSKIQESKHETEKAEFVKSQQAISDFQLRYEKTAESNEAMKTEVQALTNSLNEAKSQIADLAAKNERLLKSIAQREDRISSLQKDIKERSEKALIEKGVALEIEHKREMEALEIESQRREEKKINERLSKEADELKKSLESYVSESTKIKEANTKLSEENSSLIKSAKNEELQREISESRAKSASEEAEKAKIALGQAQEQIKGLQDRLTQQISKNLEALENIKLAELKASKAQMDNEANFERANELQQQVSNAKINAEKAEGMRKERENDIKDLKKKNIALKNETKKKAEETNRYIEEINKLNEIKESYAKEIDRLRNELKEEKLNIASILSEKTEMEKESDIAKQTISSLNSSLSKIEAESSLSKRTASHLEEMLRLSQEKLSEADDQRNDLSQKVANLSKQVADVEASKSLKDADVSKLKEEILASNNENETLKKNIEALKIELEKQAIKISDVEKDASLYQKLAEDYHSKANQAALEANREREIVYSERKAKEDFSIKNSDLETKFKEMEKKAATYASEYSKMSEKLRELSQRLDGASVQLSNLTELRDHLLLEKETLKSDSSKNLLLISELKDKLASEEKEKALAFRKVEEFEMKVGRNWMETLKSILEASESNAKRLKSAVENIIESKNYANLLQAKVAEFAKQTADAEERLAEAQKSKKSEKIKQSLLSNHIKSQKAIIAQLMNENTMLKDEVDLNEKRFAEERKEAESDFVERIKILQQKFSDDIGNSSMSEQNLANKVKSLEIENERLGRDVRRQKQEKDAGSLQIETLVRRLETLGKRCLSLEKDNENLERSLTESISSLNIGEAKLQASSKENQRLIRKVGQLSEQNDQLSMEKSASLSYIAEAQAATQKVSVLQRKVTFLSSSSEELKKVCLSIYNGDQFTLIGAQRTYEEQSPAVTQLTLQLSTFKGLIESSHNEIEELRQSRDALIREINERKKKARSEETLRSSARIETDELREKCKALENEAKQLANLKDEGDKERQNLNSGLEKLRGALQMIKENLSRSEKDKLALKELVTRLRIELERVAHESKVRVNLFDR